MKLYGVKSSKDERILSVINLSKLIAIDVESKKEHSAHLIIYLEGNHTHKVQFQSKIEAEHERFKIITEYLGFPHEYAVKLCGGNFENVPIMDIPSEPSYVNRFDGSQVVHDILLT